MSVNGFIILTGLALVNPATTMSTRKGTFWAFKRSRFQVDHLAYKWLLEIALKVLPSQYDDERREEFITDIFEQGDVMLRRVRAAGGRLAGKAHVVGVDIDQHHPAVGGDPGPG